jgi:hypothetical protein
VIPGNNFGTSGGREVGRPQFRTDFKIGAGRQMEQEILLDGTPNSSVDFAAAAYLPPGFSTQEFKIHTNAFSAEYGRTTGRAEYGNQVGHQRAGREKPPFIRNQFGFNVGGPIPLAPDGH